MSSAIQEVLDTIAAFAGSYWATLAIAAVGGYLGLFTVLRRIVFTSVALAQLAAAGVAASFFLADRPGLPIRVVEFLHRHGPTVGSLGFSLMGMLGLESRGARRRLSTDALVGLAYAAASALAILLVWRSATGLVELRNILAGDVLLSSEGERMSLWFGLLLVVVLHVVHRRPFLLVSYDPDFARAQGYDERHYQWLLMGSLAVAVALALKTAGLLLVFSVLVLPALSGLSLGRTLREARLLAICAGMTATLSGFAVSVRADWPVAPSISLVLLLAFVAAAIGQRWRRFGFAVRLVLFTGALASLAVGSRVFSAGAVFEAALGDSSGSATNTHFHAPTPTADQRALDEARLAMTGAGQPEQRASAAQEVARLGGEAELGNLVGAYGDESSLVREGIIEGLRPLMATGHALGRLRQISNTDEPERAALAARVLAALGHSDGLYSMIECLGRAGAPLLLRDEIALELQQLSGSDFGYDSFSEADSPENESALKLWYAWWTETRDRLRFDEESGWVVGED